MSKTSCILYPEINGKPSKLYKDLLDKSKISRPLTNWVYAAYTSSNAADAMDQAGYKRNIQGEHNAKDVMEFLKVNEMLNEAGKLSVEAERYGITNQGQPIDFQDSKTALELADNFNDNHTGLVATVTKHSNVYNILVSEKDARTHNYSTEVKERLKVWDMEKQVFNSVGIDIEAMPQELSTVFTPYNIDLADQLYNLQQTSINNMFKKHIQILFNMAPTSQEVQRVVKAFGSIDAAAQAVDDINHGIGSYTTAQKTLLNRAVTHCKQFNGLDLIGLKQQVAQMSQQVSSTSPEEAIKNTLQQLNKKYKININEIHRVSDKITSLSEAATDAAVTLERQIKRLEKEQGNNAEAKRLSGILNQLMNELASKKYYSGILNFLSEASRDIKEIDNILQTIPTTGTRIEKAFETAKILQNIRTIRDQYYALISALADEHLIIDESISTTDIDNIRKSAQDLKQIFDSKTKVLQDLEESTMVDILTEVIGDTAPNGQAIVNVVRMAASDSSIFDYLYSVGRASNPIVAAMGAVIRNAQDSRDQIMNDISLRIRRATDKLYRSGQNSEFMYEDDGHIISDINWDLYKKARAAAIQSFFKQGLVGYDLKQAIENWEEVNTEDRVVDKTNGRTERVPNLNYRKPFPRLTKEQIEYYNEMMQLKGEIGSLLPAYAQHQYLPPQVRREMLDALGHARNIKDVAKAIKNKVENLWTIREDDTDYKMNGIIDGDEYRITDGAFDNTPLKQIPIFFVNKVEQSELLKNFSSGLAALAGTAVNYDAMSNVAQVVEFIGDFAKNQQPRPDQSQAEIVENKVIRVFKDLRKKGLNDNTVGLIDGYIDQLIYGQRQAEHTQLSKFWNEIIAYTSFKGLSTNFKGAFANYTVGEFQMLIEAGAGEFYGLKDYLWAHTKLFGGAGVGGELAELLTNNMNHKGTLFREMFDPIQENYSDKSNTKYYKSMFRQLVSVDCSFIGYASGEYLIHYVNMYSVLHNQKLLLNGKQISMFDAFEVTNEQDNNSELRLKQGVTMLDGSPVTPEFIDSVRKKIRYVNQSTHGSMNAEDKGLIHQHWWGRGIMNFRQWMVEHYSRRFRKRYFDASLGMDREGYWVSLYHHLFNEDTKDTWKEGNKKDAIGMFMKDLITFIFRAESQWTNLTEQQKYNVKRVHSEMTMYAALLGLSFALGEPDEHKKEFWRRWWIYQTKRLILDTQAAMPSPKAISSGLTILQSPMAGVNTINSLLYTVAYGPFNGDLWSTYKSGPHKGENRYWTNVKKYMLPFFKDIEQMQRMSEDETIFQIFKDTPSNR